MVTIAPWTTGLVSTPQVATPVHVRLGTGWTAPTLRVSLSTRVPLVNTRVMSTPRVLVQDLVHISVSVILNTLVMVIIVNVSISFMYRVSQ